MGKMAFDEHRDSLPRGNRGLLQPDDLRLDAWCALLRFLVLFLVSLSFFATRHIKRNPVTPNFVTAAFIFEVLLAASLGVNVAYSLSVQREMGVAGAEQRARKETIDSIGKLRGSRNQRQA